MQLLSTDTEHLPAPVRLAAPVQDAHGQLLLPTGADVTIGVLRGLRNRGIHTVQVDEVPNPSAAVFVPIQDPALTRTRIEERLKHLFRAAIGTGQINPLFHLVLEHRLRSERHDSQASQR